MKISDELREFADAEVLSAIEISDLKRIADLIDHEMVKLPKDADGVPIHVGDKVTEHEDGHTFKVDGFMDWDGEWWVFMRDGIQAPASRCTHHHEPTVEDVLIKMLEKAVGYSDAHTTVALNAIAEFAAKLQLRENK